MPPLSLNKLLGALKFASHNLELPTDYLLVPQHDRDAYVGSLQPQDRIAIPKLIPQWFKPALPIAPHQLMCDTAGQQIKDVHDLLLDAVGYGHNMWRLQAQFTPMPIAGPVVAGPPGSLSGPPLDSLIKQYPPLAKLSGYQRVYVDAFAGGVGKAFDLWQKGVSVPGLPLYPGYAMQPPGPAIPMPSIPQKLIACLSPGMTAILIPNVMKELMLAEFRLHNLVADDSTDALFDALATVLSLGFAEWLSNQMVIGLVGSGAVGSPMGGPVAGVTMPTPGHLAT